MKTQSVVIFFCKSCLDHSWSVYDKTIDWVASLSQYWCSIWILTNKWIIDSFKHAIIMIILQPILRIFLWIFINLLSLKILKILLFYLRMNDWEPRANFKSSKFCFIRIRYRHESMILLMLFETVVNYQTIIKNDTYWKLFE